jgi:hypothetical protein
VKLTVTNGAHSRSVDVTLADVSQNRG